MVELRNVQSSFEGRQILKGVSFVAQPRQITALVGASGSGKSTVLKLIMGFFQPDRGEILIEGENIVGLPERKLLQVRRKMGMVFQHSALFDSMTVAENVGFYPFYVERQPWRKVQPSVKELLGELGMADDAKKLPGELSGGMQRRVALARALIYHPQILLYDEPTTGLDPHMTSIVDELIMETNEKFGITSIVVSHDLPSVHRIADHVILLSNGESLDVGPPEELVSSSDPKVMEFTKEWRSQVEQLSQLDNNHNHQS
jgi:phospholipid/cholesterol/gamma-HCH transport system ATP-binding protein